MDKEVKFHEIINTIIDEINTSKNKSKLEHKAGNIKSSGDEIEDLIREKISLFLPEKYLVKQGHVINSEGKVSPQLDIIIFDRLNTPKFFESSNNTVYYPIESVLAIGEIKKTLRKNDLIEFSKKIKFLKDNMGRELIENTIFGGKITSNSSLSDMITMRTDRKYKNPLFSFVFAIDGTELKNYETADDFKYMPNDICVLNQGYLLYGTVNKNNIIAKIEDESPSMTTWVAVKKSGVICLATLLNHLISHLNMCLIEPFSISNYMADKDDFGIKGNELTTFSMNKK